MSFLHEPMDLWHLSIILLYHEVFFHMKVTIYDSKVDLFIMKDCTG